MGSIVQFIPESSGITHIYVCLAIVIALVMARKTKNYWLTFTLILWVLGQPILNAFYVFSPKWLPFDFQPNRILLLILICVFFINTLKSSRFYFKKIGDKVGSGHNIYLVIFILSVVVSMIINRDVLDIKRIIAIPLEPITFLLLYQVSRRFVDEVILNKIIHSIIIMASINALVSIVQVFLDPYFMRTGIPRIAYGNVFRAFGFFPSEYVLGGFQLIALFSTFSVINKAVIKYSVIALLIVSIVLTFHRLDLLIMIAGVLFYVMRFLKLGKAVPIVAVLLLFFIAVIPGYLVMKSMTGESALVQERLADDTISGRLKQFSVVISELPKYPLGLGSYDNPIYQKLMIENKMTKSVVDSYGVQRPVGLGVHNGFLGAGIQYGVIGMLVFTIYLWKLLIYFYKRTSKSNPVTLIPFFSVFIWLLSNVSNGIISFFSYNVLITALICGSFVGIYEKNNNIGRGNNALS